jgi:hypothetical protein|tara:strand:- start:394 stop:537 length:144 start_codon:yes stop_codon:yes gene_type:complete
MVTKAELAEEPLSVVRSYGEAPPILHNMSIARTWRASSTTVTAPHPR